VGLMRNQFDVLISWIRCGLILRKNPCENYFAGLTEILQYVFQL
jgi:hypothetical protein